MSNKLPCPECGALTSAIFRAYDNGLPCPYCGGDIATRENARLHSRQLPDDQRWPPKTAEGE